MTRPTIPLPPRPVDLEDVPTHRYWGDRKPPKNRAEFFSHALNGPVPAGATDEETASAPAASSVGTLRLYGPIDSWGGWWGISAADVSAALDSFGDVDTVVVRINSPGGEAWEGMAIANMLRAHAARIVCVVDGVAASAASYIATAGDETVMSPGTQMMIHDASTFAYGPPAVMQKAATFLSSVSNAIASLYTEKAGGTDEAWRALMVETTWYTAKEAVEAKLADRVAVVADIGTTSTAGDEDVPDIDPEVEDRFDLGIFAHAGRSQAPAPKLPTASAGGHTHTEGGTAVAFSDEQITDMRRKLGIAEDADEATILAALDEALNETETTVPGNATPKVPAGMSIVETAVLDELRTGAAAGREAQATLRNQERDRVIDSAVRDGRITPARREHWAKSYDADPEGAGTLLASLEPGLAVPTSEVGHGGEPEAGDFTTEQLDAFAEQLGLPKEAFRG